MPESNRTRAAGSSPAIWLAAIILFSLSSLQNVLAAQQAGVNSASAEAIQPKVRELLHLIADPQVQEWLVAQSEAQTAAKSSQESADSSLAHLFDSRIGAIHQ